MVKGEGIPEYLKKGWGESRCRRVIRLRLGNEMREGLYWEKEENRKCRVCYSEEEHGRGVGRQQRSVGDGRRMLEGYWDRTREGDVDERDREN